MVEKEQARVQEVSYKRCTKQVFLTCDQTLSKVSLKELIFQ